MYAAGSASSAWDVRRDWEVGRPFSPLMPDKYLDPLGILAPGISQAADISPAHTP
jgi:hypothetical protein